MNSNMPQCELPPQWTASDGLAASIEFAREAMSLRLGHDVEVAALETVDREGHANLRVYWRRTRPALYVVAARVERGE
jgi:hypothetical protein